MSQTIVPARRQPDPYLRVPAANGGTPPGPVRRVIGALRRGVSGSPGKLRVAAGLAIVAALVAGIGGAAALRDRSAALEEARSTAENVVLLQGVRTALVEADAATANSFLQGGLENPTQRRTYVENVARASDDLARAARAADAADAEALGRINDQLTRYVGLVETARANNRQDLPIGQTYLLLAAELLSPRTVGADGEQIDVAAEEGISPGLDALVAAETDRVGDAYSRGSRASLWLAVAAILGFGGLVWIQIWLARRTRRFVNVPAAAGAGVLLVALVAAAVAMGLAQSTANDVRDGDYDDAVGIGEARVAAFDAKSTEALGLIDRGQGADWEPQWSESYSAARSAAQRGGTGTQDLISYGNEHAAIRALDDEGNWDGAVAAATEPANDAVSANGFFAAFAASSGEDLQAYSTAALAGLDDARGGLLAVSALLFLAGLAAAVGAWWGISLRLSEYA